MRLKQLKLAGFKSFVDPTVIPFPSHLAAVVGPNGCGKSNIIDAVRWVMGESSAKNLRGECMVDVIFNGSSNRKSLGQASVELIFDNSLGRIGGPYANYQEVAIKRLVTRDGDSVYFLNGARCRRRDISDLFLGTGAGARGYAIIGQDMIARIIDAKPDDLRAYLEEAAGVSIYKERRRETLQRIAHTRDNLTRIADVCAELAKQLVRLEKQAKTAERYKELKQRQREHRINILKLKWRGFEGQKKGLLKRHHDITRQLKEQQDKQAFLAGEYRQVQEAYQCSEERFQTLQTSYYESRGEIERLKAAASQHQQEKERLTEELKQIEFEKKTAGHNLTKHQTTLAEQETALKVLQAQLKEQQAELTLQQKRFKAMTLQAATADKKYQVLTQEHNQFRREMDALALEIKHRHQQRQQILLQQEKNHAALNECCESSLRAELEELAEAVRQGNRVLDEAVLRHQSATDTAVLCREEMAQSERTRHAQQALVQRITTEYTALKAVQEAALKKSNHRCLPPAWQKRVQLVDVLNVEEQWAFACEMVLGSKLQAIVLQSLDELLSDLTNCPGGTFVTCADFPQSNRPCLLDKISGAIPNCGEDFSQIFTVETLQDALTMLPHLTKAQSVITPDGYWFNKDWVKISQRTGKDDDGLLARKQKLAKLNDERCQQIALLQTLEEQHQTLQHTLNEAFNQVDECKDRLMTKQNELQQRQFEHAQKQSLLEQTLNRSRLLKDEARDLQERLEKITAKILTLQEQNDSAQNQEAHHALTMQMVSQEKDRLEKECRDLQELIASRRERLFQMERQCDKANHTIQQLLERIQLATSQIEALEGKQALLESRVETIMEPGDAFEQQLTKAVSCNKKLNESLQIQREERERLRQRKHDLELSLKNEEPPLKTLQEQIQHFKLEEQKILVQMSTLQEALAEYEVYADEPLSSSFAEQNLSELETALKEVEDKLQRLGAINLVAIEEYQTELTRKEHLDRQYTDLSDALATLESAIAKMDAETQLRLKNTFDEVNQSFQALFPRLFGGGRAKLELTCDNILEAGVQVIAQPPGKRNSTIHMLSGGEKAMTAVALVFAIFQLNPAPFCMLDEVDAPLDDANVGRFCAMVRDMAHCVQFLFITHNKVTMELAEQLIGVTMREPGVSRIVAVDVEEALSYIN